MWEGGEIYLVAAGVIHLGNDAEVGQTRRVADGKLRSRCTGQNRFHGGESSRHPACVPLIEARFIMAERLAQILEHAQIVQRVDVACDRQRYGKRSCPIGSLVW